MCPLKGELGEFQVGVCSQRKEGGRHQFAVGKQGLRLNPFEMQRGIERFRRRKAAGQIEESSIGFPPAQTARAMTCGEGGCLIEKEKLRPTIGLHQLPLPALVFQLAEDPGTMPPSCRHELLLRVMQNSAIARKQATSWTSFNL